MAKRQSVTSFDLRNDIDTRVLRIRAALDMIFVLAGEGCLDTLRKDSLVTATGGALEELDEVEELLSSLTPALKGELEGKQS